MTIALNAAERQRRYRARNRAVDIATDERVPVWPIFTSGGIVIHLANTLAETLCGGVLLQPVWGNPERCRICIACLGQAAWQWGLSEMVIAEAATA